MKILFFADVHLRSASDRPRYRLDNHYENQFQELCEIRDIALNNKVELMISLGDFYDHTRVSHQLITDTLAWCKTLPCSLYSIVGNHDVNGYVTTDRNNGLGVLFEAGAVEELKELVFDDQKVIIRGIHAYLDPRKGNYMFDQKYNDYCAIVASHNFIIPHEVPFDAVLPSQVQTNANIVALGHYHKTFNVYEKNTAFINPGSISRWSINEQHQPQVFIVDTAMGVIAAVPLKCSKNYQEIFDLQAAMEIKSTELNLQHFVESLEKTNFEQQDIFSVVRKVGKEQNISEPILILALEKIELAKCELK